MLTTGAQRTPEHQGRADERGSVAFAMLVLMLLSLMGIALLARSQNELKTTAASSAGARASQAAEQGVAETLARIENGARGELIGSISVLDGTVSYRAEPLTAGRYQVESTAIIDDRSRTIVATISGSPTYSEVLFLTGPASISGSSISIEGDIGTNSELVMTSSRTPSGLQRLYGPDASCRGCPSPLVISAVKEIPQPTTPPRVQACPAQGRFSAVVDGLAGVPFDCSGSAVTFNGTVVVANGPVVVRVADKTDLVFEKAEVNTAGGLGDLRFEVAGSAGVVRFDTSSVKGLLIAPDRRMSAADTRFVGALVIADLTVGPSGRLSIGGAEEAAEIAYQDWRVVTWRTDP